MYHLSTIVENNREFVAKHPDLLKKQTEKHGLPAPFTGGPTPVIPPEQYTK